MRVLWVTDSLRSMVSEIHTCTVHVMYIHNVHYVVQFYSTHTVFIYCAIQWLKIV